MRFIVLEIQSDNESAACLINSYENRNDAEAKFYAILSAAAVSSVPTHSAVLLTDTGHGLKSETYEHIIEENEFK